MLTILNRPLTSDEATAIAAWRYAPPYDLYDGDGSTDTLLRRDPHGYGYYPVADGDELVGFVCFGEEARVRGQQDEPGTCDIGAGFRPDRLSQRLGTTVLPLAVAFAAERFRATRVRVAIAAFNERSQRLCRSAGFAEARRFDGPADRPFVELVREL